MKNRVKDLLYLNGKIVAQRSNESYLQKHGVYDWIMQQYDDSYSLSEKIYCIINDLDNRKHCLECNKPLIFKHGYGTFCSRKCANSNKEVQNKIAKSVSLSLKHTYNTRGNEIKEKRSISLEKRYGEKVVTPFAIKDVQDSIKSIIQDKYNVENIFYLKKYRSDGRKLSQDKSILRNKIQGYEIEYLDKNLIKVKNLCEIHGDVTMKANDFYNRTYRGRDNTIQCTICNPINTFSSFELNFKNLLSELNIINYKENIKSIITPYELDFYFEQYNLAIELNGVYWHSELHKNQHYHAYKYELCKNKNIKLIQVWEDDYYNKYEIVKSMIKYHFNLIDKKIYARECTISEIKSKEYRTFLEENHLQGKINSSIRLGLFYKNELISTMGFGKLRISTGNKHKNEIYELHRFCSKINTNVVGGASKLLKHFEKMNVCSELITYAKKDYSDGSLYKTLGFSFYKNTTPGVYWLIDGRRKHRFNYRKDQISTKENENKTAVEIMHEKGHIRCYDSGNLVFKKQL